MKFDLIFYTFWRKIKFFVFKQAVLFPWFFKKRFFFFLRKIFESLFFFIWNGKHFVKRRVQAAHAKFRLGDLASTKVRGAFIHRRNRAKKAAAKKRKEAALKAKKAKHLKQQLAKARNAKLKKSGKSGNKAINKNKK